MPTVKLGICNVDGATKKIPAVAVAIKPAWWVSADLKGVAGQDSTHGVVAMRSSATPWRGEPGPMGDSQDVGDDRARDNKGGRRVRLEVDEGIEAAGLDDVLVLHAHVPAAVGPVGPRLHLDGGHHRLVGGEHEDVDGRCAWRSEGRQHPVAIELVEHVVLTGRPYESLLDFGAG